MMSRIVDTRGLNSIVGSKSNEYREGIPVEEGKTEDSNIDGLSIDSDKIDQKGIDNMFYKIGLPIYKFFASFGFDKPWQTPEVIKDTVKETTVIVTGMNRRLMIGRAPAMMGWIS